MYKAENRINYIENIKNKVDSINMFQLGDAYHGKLRSEQFRKNLLFFSRPEYHAAFPTQIY